MSMTITVKPGDYAGTTKLEGGWWLAFNIEECDNCSKPCMAPNAIKLSASPPGALEFPADKVPEELGFCEALGCATCDDCYEDEEE